MIHHLNSWCVADRLGGTKLPPISYPVVSAEGYFKTYRGGGFDERCCAMYKVGQKMRIPGFTCTSANRSTAKVPFMRKASENGMPAIEWTFLIPHGCKHINYIDKRLSLIEGESEFTLAPYTAVDVVE